MSYFVCNVQEEASHASDVWVVCEGEASSHQATSRRFLRRRDHTIGYPRLFYIIYIQTTYQTNNLPSPCEKQVNIEKAFDCLPSTVSQVVFPCQIVYLFFKNRVRIEEQSSFNTRNINEVGCTIGEISLGLANIS